ncbi:MAG: argininosuccinate lyase [Bacteroidales bacterium]|jgi:argininosuccinate lyase|nr:argininosuccinate lyase [Bacteroidales bacterium]
MDSNTLWNKGTAATDSVESFTVGNDRILDLKLAKYDVKGSKAHIKMLASIGLLDKEEEKTLQQGLDEILEKIDSGDFRLEDDVEDIHSEVELMLTAKFGEAGEKIHSGRSRNDQVLTDIKLFLKDQAQDLRDEILELFGSLQKLSEKYKDILLPGYTHGQIAMPSSFGMWFGAYAEALIDDMYMLAGAYRVIDQNPLGSAAGYGNSFPLDREMTTSLLGFSSLNYNSVAAQLSRGKTEKALAAAMSQIASTLNRFAADCCMFMCPNFGFIKFPDEFTTGSSIMPHKKNPDVWELVRANCNRIENLTNEISLLTTNIPQGYHRDFQLLKDILFPGLEKMHSCLKMTKYMIENVSVNKNILDDPRYEYLFTVEKVNKLVRDGIPFREAYKKVGKEVNEGKFHYVAKEGKGNKITSVKQLGHTHEGSIGNLCNDKIKEKMEKAVF